MTNILLKFQASFGLQLGPRFTSTSPLKDTKRLKKRQNKLIKWWRKINWKQGTACCYALSLIKNKTLTCGKSKNILLTEIKEYTT